MLRLDYEDLERWVPRIKALPDYAGEHFNQSRVFFNPPDFSANVSDRCRWNSSVSNSVFSSGSVQPEALNARSSSDMFRILSCQNLSHAACRCSASTILSCQRQLS